MRRPLRRYCFQLAEKLKMSVTALMDTVSAAEIYEWMAYDMCKDEEFSKKIMKELEMEKQAGMSGEDRSKMLINMFKNKG